ncbi:MAG TPA: FHA domain-containing protein [Chthoniobacteraceae bacterium]|nr:FHA domain-containing protein [Chthoniobacteraceae bacterium]
MPYLFLTLSDDSTHAQEITGVVTVGRNPDNVLVIDHGSVSSFHAKIDSGAAGVFVTDLFSSNGTFVNDERVMTLKLEHGDRVRFGKVECVYSLSGG